MPIKLCLIAAVSENMGIGKNNNLPWRLKTEMEYYRRMTTKSIDKNKKNVVIMGRKTWESIPEKYKPMKGRMKFVLSRSDLDLKKYEESYSFNSFEEILKKLQDPDFQEMYENIWVIGGSYIYAEAMKSEHFYRLYLTKIHKNYDCDTFFPEIPNNLVEISDPDVPKETQSENGIEFTFHVYENPNLMP